MKPGIGEVHGAMTVEWLEGGGYLIQRSAMEDPASRAAWP